MQQNVVMAKDTIIHIGYFLKPQTFKLVWCFPFSIIQIRFSSAFEVHEIIPATVGKVGVKGLLHIINLIVERMPAKINNNKLYIIYF